MAEGCPEDVVDAQQADATADAWRKPSRPWILHGEKARKASEGHEIMKSSPKTAMKYPLKST